jgi:hypothetical protein
VGKHCKQCRGYLITEDIIIKGADTQDDEISRKYNTRGVTRNAYKIWIGKPDEESYIQIKN